MGFNRHLIVVFILIMGLLTNGLSQNSGKVNLYGLVETENVKDSIDVFLILKNKIVSNKRFYSGARYSFNLDIDKEYTIKYSSKDFISQKIIVFTQVAPNWKSQDWKLECNIGLFPNTAGLNLKDSIFLVAKYKFYETNGSPKFDFAPDDFGEVNSLNNKSEGTSNKQKTSPDSLSIEQTLEELMSEDIVSQYTKEEKEYLESTEEERAKLAEIENLRTKTSNDSALLIEKSIRLRTNLKKNAKNQEEIDRLQARNQRDSLILLEKEKKILAAEHKFDKAQQAIQIKNYEIKNQKILIISAVASLVLLFGILFIVVYNNKIKNKLNKTLELKNQELAKQRKEIEKAYNNLKEKNAEIQAQKEDIELKNQQITSSISYAKQIQEALLPKMEQIKNVFPKSYSFFVPKDIVSGDFYWLEIVDNKIFVAVVDCTGHGVPGAFMSIVGNRLLNEIIYEKKIFEPQHMLEHLNKGVKEALKQDHSDNRDGMDVCLCVLEPSNEGNIKLTYAGAKRPLYYYLKKDKNIKTLKGDRKPIGGVYYQDLGYSQKEIFLERGDIIYLTSDGYIDQNSPDGKKLGTREFLKILKRSADKDMETQLKDLKEEFEKHHQGEEQRDDVTVLAIRI